MPIELRIEHYLDSPADVITFETNKEFRTTKDRINGLVKIWYPGVYENAKTKYLFNLKQSSVLIQRSVGRDKPLVYAGCCVYYGESRSRLRTEGIQRTVKGLFDWFWSQDDYQSLGMNFIGIKNDAGNTNSLIRDQTAQWHVSAELYKHDSDERTLYIHSLESLYLAPIEVPKWDGPFEKVKLWNALFPQFEE